jgi:oligo-1,6-glucosidase
MNPKMREAVYESAMKFWLDRGINGLRMDVVGFYWKDESFPDAKIVYHGDELQSLEGKYCHNGPLVHEWLKDMRTGITKAFGEEIVLIGELPGTGKDDFVKFAGPQRHELHMALDTDIFITRNNWTDGVHELCRPELPLLKDAVRKT